MLLHQLTNCLRSGTRQEFRQFPCQELSPNVYATSATTAPKVYATLTTMVLVLMLLSRPLEGGIVSTFADINLWTGSGANQAALVIDWADGTEALVWGYRFDSAQSSDMLRAVVEADPRLYAKVEQFAFGQFIHGLGYDHNGSGFSITSGTNFGPTGFVISGVRAGATANDVNDSYWETDIAFSMIWGFWTGTGNNYPGVGWAESQIGISDRQLGNQAWDGFRFNMPGSGPSSAMAAVPEPTAAAAISWMILGFAFFRGRRRPPAH